MTQPEFTPAQAHVERQEIRRAGGIRKWLRQRVIGATAMGPGYVLGEDGKPMRDATGRLIRQHAEGGARQSFDGTRRYEQLPNGVLIRVPPKAPRTKRSHRRAQ